MKYTHSQQAEWCTCRACMNMYVQTQAKSAFGAGKRSHAPPIFIYLFNYFSLFFILFFKKQPALSVVDARVAEKEGPDLSPVCPSARATPRERNPRDANSVILSLTLVSTCALSRALFRTTCNPRPKRKAYRKAYNETERMHFPPLLH